MISHPDCPFCQLDHSLIVERCHSASAVREILPCSPGHTLVFPQRHVQSREELNDVERQELDALLAFVRQTVGKESAPHGLTICSSYEALTPRGAAFPHYHFQVIPYDTTGKVPNQVVPKMPPKKMGFRHRALLLPRESQPAVCSDCGWRGKLIAATHDECPECGADVFVKIVP